MSRMLPTTYVVVYVVVYMVVYVAVRPLRPLVHLPRSDVVGSWGPDEI